MLSTLVFRPTMQVGTVYAREVGSAQPLQPIGGVEELTITFDENKINQAQFQSPGGGNRATVNRVNSINIAAKLQDLNPVNLARSLRGLHTEVAAGTATAEAGTAIAGGLTKLAHMNPTTVVVKDATTDTAISAGDNFEVRPEGLFWYDNSVALVAAKAAWVIANPLLAPKDYPGLAIKTDYAHSGYDVIEVLTRAAPILEFFFAGVNEALDSQGSGVHFYRAQQSLTKSLAMISGSAFATLDIEAEVLQDPTKTGTTVSKYMRYTSQVPT